MTPGRKVLVGDLGKSTHSHGGEMSDGGGQGGKWEGKGDLGTPGSSFKGVLIGERQKWSRDQAPVSEMDGAGVCLPQRRTQLSGKSECAGEGEGAGTDGRRASRGQGRGTSSTGEGRQVW